MVNESNLFIVIRGSAGLLLMLFLSDICVPWCVGIVPKGASRPALSPPRPPGNILALAPDVNAVGE